MINESFCVCVDIVVVASSWSSMNTKLICSSSLSSVETNLGQSIHLSLSLSYFRM